MALIKAKIDNATSNSSSVKPAGTIAPQKRSPDRD
jgi:hypothetical protein